MQRGWTEGRREEAQKKREGKGREREGGIKGGEREKEGIKGKERG